MEIEKIVPFPIINMTHKIPLRFNRRTMINTEKSKPHKETTTKITKRCDAGASAPTVQGCPDVLRIPDHLGTSRAEAPKTTGYRQKLSCKLKNRTFICVSRISINSQIVCR